MKDLFGYSQASQTSLSASDLSVAALPHPAFNAKACSQKMSPADAWLGTAYSG